MVQSLAGFFAIFIGFNSAFLFLVDIGIIYPNIEIELGDTSNSVA
jgi:hypothetical protein